MNVVKRDFQEIAKLYEKGASLSDLAVQYKLNRGTLARNLRKLNVRVRPGGRPRKDFSEAIQLYREGFSLQKIANKYGVTRMAITRAFRIRNVKISPRGEPNRIGRSSRREEDRANRNEWRRLQRSIAHITIESRDEELQRLIEEQARDDRTYMVKYELSYDESAGELDGETMRGRHTVFTPPI